MPQSEKIIITKTSGCNKIFYRVQFDSVYHTFVPGEVIVNNFTLARYYNIMTTLLPTSYPSEGIKPEFWKKIHGQLGLSVPQFEGISVAAVYLSLCGRISPRRTIRACGGLDTAVVVFRLRCNNLESKSV